MGPLKYVVLYTLTSLYLIFQSLDSRLVVYACDFLKMKPELLEHGKCDAVYDRGAFEAILESDRKSYVQTILPLLSSDFRYLLNVYEYQDEVFKGPPRSCYRQEVTELFSGHSIEG